MPGAAGRRERADLARRGEALAAERLERAGLEILDRNWRAGRRELDLVAREGPVVAFVEVKTRGPGPQPPLEAIGRTKRREVRRAAEAWIHAHPGVGREFRFDAVAVEVDASGTVRIEHVREAFRGEDA
ncbi:MAG TPA: YraN family protein [Gemmatimonadota bacterium]|nr:YraN family protein [Gemmatimonadota bacterium]